MLRIYEVARRLIERLRPTVEAIEMRDRELGKQLKQALNSILLNLGEGSGSSGGTRRERYRNALGSARETRSCLDAALAWRYVKHVDDEGLSEIIGTLVNLTR
jgi:four helix bundle protein